MENKGSTIKHYYFIIAMFFDRLIVVSKQILCDWLYWLSIHNNAKQLCFMEICIWRLMKTWESQVPLWHGPIDHTIAHKTAGIEAECKSAFTPTKRHPILVSCEVPFVIILEKVNHIIMGIHIYIAPMQMDEMQHTICLNKFVAFIPVSMVAAHHWHLQRT